MDLSVILNPSPQSQCTVDLGGKIERKFPLHSPFAGSTSVTRRGDSSGIHRDQLKVNGCLTQPSAELTVPNNNRVSCPSSSSPPFLAPRRDNYYDQIQDQTLFAKGPRQRSIPKSLTSSRSIKDSKRHSQHIIPSHLAGHIHLQSNKMVVPHSSSIETLASVATANATGEDSSRKSPRTSGMFTEVPLEATLSCSSESRPNNHNIQEEQYERPAPEDLRCPTDLDSSPSSDLCSTATADACATDPTSTTEEGSGCSYTAGCNTGSPLRKVVSHIFGRNKLCTKKLPESVWIHYCRKHYQRSRYRNPSGYPLLQCDLLRKQIDRLEMWGGVSDWIIRLRKREALRLNLENLELAADRVADDAASDGDEEMDVGGVAKHQTPPLTSSRWLIKFTGSGKTTKEVLEVLDIIETRIRDTKCNFPDVEMLPNIPSSSHGSDDQRSLSSWSSSSVSSSAQADDAINHRQTRRSNRTPTLNNQSSLARSPARRRKLQRGTRTSML